MGEANLSYLLAHPAAVGIGLARPWALLLLAGGALFWLRRIPGESGFPTLRVAAFTGVVLCLAGLQLTTSLPQRDLALVAAVDTSGSMSDGAIDWARRYVQSVAGSMAADDHMSVLSFAASPRLIASGSSDIKLDSVDRAPDSFSTNISAAIDHALALYPQGAQKALLLVTDGNETVGDSLAHRETLRALDIRVHVSSPPPADGIDIQMAKVSAPEIASPAREVPVRAVVHNPGAPRPAVFKLYLDGTVSDATTVTLQAGVNTFDLSLRPPGPGGHVIRAEIVADADVSPNNNAREVSLTIQPYTRVLLATNRRFSALAEILEARGFAVQQARGNELPANPGAYDSTHLIVLEDLPGRAIDRRSMETIEGAVHQRGVGLIFVGGGETFGDPAYQDSPIERLLPVSMEPRRPRPGKRDPLALFLLIDRSTSMGFNSRVRGLRDGEKLRYAIEAGLAVIKQLKDHDRIGVIAFDSLPREIAPLQPLRRNRKELLANLPRIRESGGTDFFDALGAAASQLIASRVNRKHIVLLTDGDTNRADRGEYRGLIEDLAAAKISVTTIRMGDNTKNLTLLQEISNGTGGSFHYVADAQMLPDLMLRDTSRAVSRLRSNRESFFPAFGSPHQLLSEVEESDLPKLSNYAFSKPRPTSEVLLHVARSDRHDPVLGVWRYGIGRVAAFTASPGDDAEAWPAWEGFARFWSNLALWTARRGSEHDVAVAATRRMDSTEISVRSFRRDGAATILSGQLTLADGTRLEADFAPTTDGVFEASLPPLPPHRYRLDLLERTEGGGVREVAALVGVPAQLEEEVLEYGRRPADRERLRTLATATGGEIDPAAAQVTARPPGERQVVYPLDPFLIPLAMTAFFADIARRRIHAVRKSRA